MAKKQPTILVHLPSYRDPELIPTIKSALENAKYPKRVHFGICRQYHPEDTFDNVDEFRKDKRFHIMDVLYTEAQGLPWARAQINEKLLTNQDYILQLDSHHRFEKNWDTILKDYVNLLKCKGFKKPVVSAYVPGYFPETDPENRVQEVWGLNIMRFLPEGAVFLQPFHKDQWRELKEPFKTSSLEYVVLFFENNIMHYFFHLALDLQKLYYLFQIFCHHHLQTLHT